MAEQLSLPQYNAGTCSCSNASAIRSSSTADAVRRLARRWKKCPTWFRPSFPHSVPGKSVPAHEGPYYGYLRYHLGLRVPKDNPPRIVVNGQNHFWKEGEIVFFDDSWPHEVLKNGNELRAVLIVNMLRPLPFTGDIVN